MYLTGMVDKRTLEKYEREAKEKNRETWYLSWCMDTNQEGKMKVYYISVFHLYLKEKCHLMCKKLSIGLFFSQKETKEKLLKWEELSLKPKENISQSLTLPAIKVLYQI